MEGYKENCRKGYENLRNRFPIECTGLGGERVGLRALLGYSAWKSRFKARDDYTDAGERKKLRALSGGSLLFALLQSLCTEVLTISGLRVAIGLSALAAAGGIDAPARGWHQDAIRIPMLVLAATGTVINLAALAWLRHLALDPAAQWRQSDRTAKQKRSERLQVAMAVLTLILVGLEIWTHPMVHRTGPPPASQSMAE